MENKQKDRLQVAGVGLIMAGSIITVVLVAWLGDGRDKPRQYVPVATISQAR